MAYDEDSILGITSVHSSIVIEFRNQHSWFQRIPDHLIRTNAILIDSKSYIYTPLQMFRYYTLNSILNSNILTDSDQHHISINDFRIITFLIDKRTRDSGRKAYKWKPKRHVPQQCASLYLINNDSSKWFLMARARTCVVLLTLLLTGQHNHYYTGIPSSGEEYKGSIMSLIANAGGALPYCSFLVNPLLVLNILYRKRKKCFFFKSVFL